MYLMKRALAFSKHLRRVALNSFLKMAAVLAYACVNVSTQDRQNRMPARGTENNGLRNACRRLGHVDST